MDETVVFIALTLGGMVHSTAGFGSALVAMPILTLVLSPAVATPLQNSVDPLQREIRAVGVGACVVDLFVI